MLLVHRPKYDDWSFPKGKLDAGEHVRGRGASREVEEETGLRRGPRARSAARRSTRCATGTKEVRYFRMTANGDGLPQNEIDEVRWVSPEETGELLSYDYDRQLLKSLR